MSTPNRTIVTRSALAAAAALIAVAGTFGLLRADEPHKDDAPRESRKAAFQTPIGNVPGKAMTGVIVEYKPGAVTPSHRHGNSFVVAYILSGSIRSKVDDGEAKIFHEGESWTEQSGAHHVVSENASKTETARMLVIFVDEEKQKDFLFLDKK